MDEAIRIAPKNPMFRRQRANYLIQLGEWAEALYDCEVWVRWRPSEALAYCARGRCYAFYDNYLRAQEDYSKAIEINPTVALFYKLRSVAFQRSGWTCDADRDEELAEALEAKPAD
jgi:tetratricopeptide (TPR) repeat protein